jgi:hypothetical protein
MIEKLKISWSIPVMIITAVVSVILFYAISSLWSRSLTGSWYHIVLLSVLVLVPLFFISLTPVSMQMSDTRFVLKKIFGKVAIDYDQIIAVESYRFSTDMRLCGSGGFCGFTGIFFNPQKGKYSSYIVNPAQSFMITTKNGKRYAFSCKNALTAIEIIEKHIVK